MVTKKGQLSIEAMIIYGLVILVAFSVIGTLLYFNVLDLGSYLPDKCELGGTADLKCEEMAYDSSGDLHLGIRNIGQKPITNLQITVDDIQDLHFTTEETDGYTGTIGPGDIVEVVIATPGPDAGKVLRAELAVEYEYVDGVVTQQYVGTLRTKAAK
ncbi:MAG TPA: hypothetical protein VK158_01215 [Acidobacteriota bacterium]|nr:hypothetical protein [Acidobacteriota bacterium]